MEERQSSTATAEGAFVLLVVLFLIGAVVIGVFVGRKDRERAAAPAE